MEFDKHKTVCFSGYRPQKFDFPLSANYLYENFEKINLEAIYKAVKAGYVNFIIGGAPGYDILCGEMVRLARKSAPQEIKLICALPYANFKDSSHFDEHWRSRYDSVIKDCDHVINVTGKDYETGNCYMRRNKYMVDRSILLICYHTGKKGGTANTILYAKANGIIISNVAALL